MTSPLELQEACACNQPRPVTSGKEFWPPTPLLTTTTSNLSRRVWIAGREKKKGGSFLLR